MSAFFPDRRFQLWDYRVSHGSLLVRSPKGPGNATNVDLVFDGVEYVACPRLMRGLEMDSATPEDLMRLPAVLRGVQSPDQVFVLVSGGERHLVIAASCRVEEHVGDIFETPFG